MAVDHDDYVPTEDLILTKPRRHFRTIVRAIHWQLRSLIGVESQNIVYYVTGTDNKNVQRLNTTTHETETIKRLPFPPRCLVAENGWICCGGDNGDFAAIQLEEANAANRWDPVITSLLEQATYPEADPDASRSTSEDPIFLSLARARSTKSLLVESKKFGKELVNCITLWFPPTLAQPFAGAYADPVAVLSNNDRTVTVIRLKDQEAEETLTFPDCVNRAIISPDGRLLIAITDDPYLYIYERTEKPTHGNHFRRVEKPVYQWISCGKIHLRSQKPDDPTTVRGSFAACFSGTGKYLAIGTQSASISIFNVTALTIPGAEPLLACFTASRPSAEHGAVRDMAFAPGHSDLLAWTEDRGRVGIADFRNGYISRQVIALDRPDDFEHLTTTDRGTIDPRLLEQRANDGNLASSFSVALDMGPSQTRAALLDPRGNPLRYYSPLTSEETLVLEALREHRRRQEQRGTGAETGTAGTGTGAGTAGTASPTPRTWADRPARSGPTSDGNNTDLPHERSGSVTRTVSDIMNTIREQHERLNSLRAAPEARTNPDFLQRSRERVRERAERAEANNANNSSSSSASVTTDHRRTAPVPPPPGSGSGAARVGPLGPQIPSSLVTRDRADERRALRMAVDSYLSGGNPPIYPEVASFARRFPGVNPEERVDGDVWTNAIDTEAARAESRRRDRTAYLMRDWDEPPTRRVERYFARPEQPQPDPYDTAGLGWSEDGRTLYVAADDGIYELRVNQLGRKLFSSVDMR
ncbi:hypothetical protein OQA88_12947 [Cercophora sp. LCS_1]